MEMYILRLRIGFISGIAILLILIGYGLFRYPLTIPQAGVWSVAFPMLMLVLYGIAGMWATHKDNQICHPALRDGTGFGLVIAILFVLLILIENFAGFNDQIITPLTLVFMLFIFICFFVVGWRCSLKFDQIRLGLFASLWGALVGVLIALFFGFMINFLYEHQLEQTLQASSEYLRGSIQDLRTFTFYNTLDSASTHLFEVPIIAIVFGVMGSLMSRGFTYLRGNFSRQSK